MNRLKDVLSGVVIGVGIFGMYACFIDGNLSLDDFCSHMIIILCGFIATFAKFN